MLCYQARCYHPHDDNLQWFGPLRQFRDQAYADVNTHTGEFQTHFDISVEEKPHRYQAYCFSHHGSGPMSFWRGPATTDRSRAESDADFHNKKNSSHSAVVIELGCV